MAPCSIRWCGKTSKSSSLQKDGITFHMYPRYPDIKSKWINATRRVDWFPSKSSVICSRHFTPDCFLSMKSRRRLLGSAVPTLFLPILSAEDKSDEDIPSTSKVNTTATKTKSFSGSLSKYESVMKNRMCRRIIELKDKVVQKNRQLKSLREKMRYMQKRLDSTKTVLRELVNKKLIDSSDSDLLTRLRPLGRLVEN